MAAYHEELSRAGVFLDGSGLQPSSKGWRVQYDGKTRTIVGGPFTEAKELVAGYTLIQTRTRDEAIEWSRRFPIPSAKASPAKSRCGSSTSWRTSRPAGGEDGGPVPRHGHAVKR